MSTIIAILEAEPDGTIHLPLPQELRHGKVEVTATLRAVGDSTSTVASPDQVARRRAALLELRSLGGLLAAIPDPAAWQRDQRHCSDGVGEWFIACDANRGRFQAHRRFFSFDQLLLQILIKAAANGSSIIQQRKEVGNSCQRMIGFEYGKSIHLECVIDH